MVRLSENIAINMVTVSFNTTVRQMTQMSPQKTDWNVSAKKQHWSIVNFFNVVLQSHNAFTSTHVEYKSKTDLVSAYQAQGILCWLTKFGNFSNVIPLLQ